MSESVKLCKDCRFGVKERITVECSCAHPNNMSVTEDLVMGQHTRRYQFSCNMLRGLRDKCGPTGSWFEPTPVLEAVPPIPAAAPTPRKAWSFPHMSLVSWMVLLAAEFYVIVASLRLGTWLMNQRNDAAFVLGMLVMVLLPFNAAGLGVTVARKFLVTNEQ